MIVKTLGSISNYTIDADEPAKHSNRLIEVWGQGWYSLCSDGVFRKGRFPTYCRIRLVAAGLSACIEANRTRQGRLAKARKLQAALRLRHFDYQDAARLCIQPHRQASYRADMLLARCRKLLKGRSRDAEHRALELVS
jgi:hypothetical protein